MRALRFHAAHDLRIEEVAEPPAPGPGEVVVRVVTCGICGTDLHEYMAGPIVTPVEPHPLTGAQNPQILGHEFAGDVVAVGPGRDPRRRRAIASRSCRSRTAVSAPTAGAGCSTCARRWAASGSPTRGAGWPSSRPSPSTRSCGCRAGVTHRQGALIEPTAVAAYGVERAGRRPGRQGARDGRRPDRRARRAVRSLGRRLHRLRLGAQPGPTRAGRGARGRHRARPGRRRRTREFLHEQSDGLGIDVVIECSGHPSGFDTGIRSLRRRGTLAQTGLFVGEASVEPMLWSLNDLTIVGTWCYWVYDFERIAAQIAAGDLPVERVVTSSGALDDAPDAFASLASGKADEIKVLINQ